MPTRRLAHVLGVLSSALVVGTSLAVVAPPAAAAGTAQVWAFLETPATRVYNGANAGLRFGVAGTGFAPRERVTVTYRGVAQTFEAKAGGRSTAGSFASGATAFGVEPDAVPDDARLVAVGSLGSSASLPLAVQAPIMTADPATGGPGGLARIVGTGFASGATVSFGSSDGAVPTPVVAAVRGWFVVDVVLPTTVGGTRTLTAVDGYRSATGTATLLAPRLVVDRISNPAGADVTVKGEHLRPGGTVHFSADNPESGFTPPGTATVDGYGRVLVTAPLPGDACSGATVVTARDAVTGSTVSGSFLAASSSSEQLRAREVTGCSISAGDTLTSPRGRFSLAVQTDGNLVLYDAGRPVWATGTFTSNPRLVMQPDGNVVLYAGGRPVWATGSRGPGHWLNVKDDTGLSLLDAAGWPIWSAPVTDRLVAGQQLRNRQQIGSPDGAYRLAYEDDDSVFQYGPGNAVLWAVTNPRPSTVILQSDGNFVMYGDGGSVLFASHTSGVGNVLVVQGDGNLVVYSAIGRALWALR